jgi:hypothetical protein
VTFGLGSGSGRWNGWADTRVLRQARLMTTPEREDPQPRDIALEQETPELAADLEAQSEPADGRPSEES